VTPHGGDATRAPPVGPSPDTGGGSDKVEEPHPDDKGAGLVDVVPGDGGEEPAAEALALAAIAAAGDEAGAAATVSAGVMLGILAAASGLAWAIYKCKPGLIPLGGAAARGGGAPAGGPAADAPLLESVTPAAAPPVESPTGAGGAGGPEGQDIGTMTAAGYSSLKAGAGGAARGFGVSDSRTLTLTQSMVGGGAASPTSTMNRGIQTDVGDGAAEGAGLGAAGGAASSTFVQSTTVKSLYSSQADGSVPLSEKSH